MKGELKMKTNKIYKVTFEKEDMEILRKAEELLDMLYQILVREEVKEIVTEYDYYSTTWSDLELFDALKTIQNFSREVD